MFFINKPNALYYYNKYLANSTFHKKYGFCVTVEVIFFLMYIINIHALDVRHKITVTGTGELLLNILGKCIADIDYDIMMELLMIAGHAISRMYMRIERTKPKKIYWLSSLPK